MTDRSVTDALARLLRCTTHGLECPGLPRCPGVGSQRREAAARVEDEIARLEGELTEWRTSIATEKLVERAEAAEARVASLEQSFLTEHTRRQLAEAEVARLNEDIAGFRNMGISQSESIVALRDELARLKDGLREIARQKPDGTAARAVQIARALLAEDGEAQEDYEACCDHDRIAGRHVICDLRLGHDGPHQMGGARWRRAEDGAARAPEGFQWDYLGPDPNDPSGEKWGWMNEAGEVWDGAA